MSEQLRLCPCGLPAQSYTTESANGVVRYAIGCNDPLCQWTAGEYDTEADAIAAWNQRATETEAEVRRLQGKVHWLEGQNKRLQEILDGWQVETYGDY